MGSAMEAAFWRERWRTGQTGWRQPDAHLMLPRHFSALSLKPGARVFAPLCGDALDVDWLLRQGYRVAGVELVESAVAAMFARLGVAPRIEPAGALVRYATDGIEIFVGDVFALDRATLGPVAACWDRAALIALPPETRARYAAHGVAITDAAPQLLVTLGYDQSLIDGPPFSVGADEVRALYGATYEATILESVAVEGGLKGRAPATETAWLLAARGV